MFTRRSLYKSAKGTCVVRLQKQTKTMSNVFSRYTQRIMDADRNFIPFMRVDLPTTTTTSNVIIEEIRHEVELEYVRLVPVSC